MRIFKLLIGFVFLFSFLVLKAQPALVGQVNFNQSLSNVFVSEKLELVFHLNRTVPLHYAEPHNPNVVEIYAIISNGKKNITVNAFYDEEVEETGNCKGLVRPGEIYPRTKFNYLNNNNRLASQRWIIRHSFRLDETGNWTLKLMAKDNINPGAGILKEIFDTNFHVVSNAGAKGFIVKKEARNSFLYHENGEMCFMIGMNEHFSNNSENYICRMRDVIDKASQNNANILKIWIDGNPEWFFTPVIYGVAGKSEQETEFHTTVFNSKNAKLIDLYLDYAKTKDVNIEMVLFDPGNLDDQNYYEGWRRYCPFNNKHDTTYPSIVDNRMYYNEPDLNYLDNPWDIYPPVSGLSKPYEIFYYQKYYLRYCAARWGYATNLVAWEIGKEINISAPELKIGKQIVDLDKDGVPDTNGNGQIIYVYDTSFKQPPDMVLRFKMWLDECKRILKNNDACNHLVTASPINPFYRNGQLSPYKKYPLSLEQYTFLSNMDISVSGHYYPDPICFNADFCKRLIEKEEHLFNAATVYLGQLNIPHHIQEWGQGDDECEGFPRTWHQDIDPMGFDLHNVTLSSAFTGGFGSALSFNAFFSIQPLQQYQHYKGLGNFMKQFKDLGNVVNSRYFKTNLDIKVNGSCEFDNNADGLRVAYMVSIDDSNHVNILGWCQDKKFSLSKLYWNHRNYLLTLDKSIKPIINKAHNSFDIEVYNSEKVLIKWFETTEGKHLDQFDTFLSPAINDNRFFVKLNLPYSLHNSDFADAFFRIVPTCKILNDCNNNELTLFPNPVGSYFRVSNRLNSFLEFENIQLINSLGQTVYRLENANSHTEYELPLLSQGIYYLGLMFEDQNYNFKIFVK